MDYVSTLLASYGRGKRRRESTSSSSGEEVEPKRHQPDLVLSGEEKDNSASEGDVDAVEEVGNMPSLDSSESMDNQGKVPESEPCLDHDNKSPDRGKDDGKNDGKDVDVTLDEKGDLVLIIRGETDTRVRVRSDYLRWIGPYWEDLLDTAVAFPVIEGYPKEAVLAVLSVTHHALYDVPDWINLDDIWGAFLFCFESDTIDLMRPFLRRWLCPFMSTAVQAGERVGSRPGNKEWLFMSWVLGYRYTFEAVTRHMAATMASDEAIYEVNGKSLVSQGDEEPEDAETEVYRIILSNVSRVRACIIIGFIDVCHYIVERLSEKKLSCRIALTSEPCESRALGSFIRGLGLMRTPVWPQRPDLKHLAISTNDLLLDFMEVNLPQGPAHEDCPDFDFLVHDAIVSCLCPYHGPIIWPPTVKVGYLTLEKEHEDHFWEIEFGGRVSEADPLIWKSKTLARWGFTERDEIGLAYNREDQRFEDLSYDSDSEDSDWYDQHSDSASNPTSEPGEEYWPTWHDSDYDSDDIPDDGWATHRPKTG
ncbi:hypothetical protein BU16DRAFT_556494 [Lophium mytilinum]|uniref:Uncharacterized protein n=1 Tax=Lophium mytilinum TaxID=390894 RepID=A0A6A6R6M5_9PEZI|nr:hypothetical protein BU16DRAFT_556494 [Lophium mytilinum]